MNLNQFKQIWMSLDEFEIMWTSREKILLSHNRDWIKCLTYLFEKPLNEYQIGVDQGAVTSPQILKVGIFRHIRPLSVLRLKIFVQLSPHFPHQSVKCKNVCFHFFAFSCTKIFCIQSTFSTYSSPLTHLHLYTHAHTGVGRSQSWGEW